MAGPRSDRPVEQRVITALLVDVVGSTALTVRLGPERFKRALDHAFLELKQIINAEGGTLEKFVGDAIYALFGAPVAHADDPQRALRAACASMQWAENSSRTSAVPLSVRIGLETGEAIVDLAATETQHQQTSVGACVVFAARLQQLAEPGQILVGPHCHAMNAEVAEFAALGEVELKGLGPQPVWRLEALRIRRPALRPPFVGRASELERLELAYRRARSGRSVFALVSGPPGQGKTRLVEEFVAKLGGNPGLLKARCRPGGELGARGPLRELLSIEAVGLLAEELHERLAGLFLDALERHRVFSCLAHSAGLIVAPELSALPMGQRQDEIENGWRRYLAALSRARPLVLWIDDLHWADLEVVQLLDRLTFTAEVRALVVATARPEFDTTALRSGENRLFITLGELSGEEAQSLARYTAVGEPMRVERAEGNPLFIVELARARQINAKSELPMTLKGIIGARLDELPLPDRELLQRAAVVGETFTIDDAILLSGRESSEVGPTLERLAQLMYLQPVPAGKRFHHALVRDVAYGRLSAADRLTLHARFAQHGIPPDNAESLAHHLWEAIGPPDAGWVWEGNDALTGLQARALAAHLESARRYAARFAYGRALEACHRALRFASDPLDVGRVEQAFGDVCVGRGDADDAWAHYLRARATYRSIELAPPPNLYPSLLEPRIYTSGMFVRLPDEALVETLLEEGEVAARGADDVASLARLLGLRAYRSHDGSQLEQVLQLSREITDAASLESFLEHMAILQDRLGDFGAARRTYERLDALTSMGGVSGRQSEFRAILALNIGSMGESTVSVGCVREADDLARRFLAESASRGPHLQTHAHREQSHVLLARGDWPSLCDLAVQTERLVAEHPETSFCYAVTVVLSFAAVAHALSGQVPQARELLVRAELPLQAEPLERESVLLLARGVLGQRGGVNELRREVRRRGAEPFWYFCRMEAVVLTMLELWDELDEVLSPLEQVAMKGSPYIQALLTAIREEMAAAKSGPPPSHAMLRKLGFTGWSQLLAYRPVAH